MTAADRIVRNCGALVLSGLTDMQQKRGADQSAGLSVIADQRNIDRAPLNVWSALEGRGILALGGLRRMVGASVGGLVITAVANASETFAGRGQTDRGSR